MYLSVGIAHQLLMALEIILDLLQVIGFGFILHPLSLRCELKTWAVSLQHWVFLYWWTTGWEACLNECWQHCVIFTGLPSCSTVHGALGILRSTLSYMGRSIWALDRMCGFQWYCQLRELSSRWWITHCQQVYVLLNVLALFLIGLQTFKICFSLFSEILWACLINAGISVVCWTLQVLT